VLWLLDPHLSPRVASAVAAARWQSSTSTTSESTVVPSNEDLFRMDGMLDPWESFGLTNSALVQQPALQQALLQLPEVEQTLRYHPGAIAMELLQRAIQIFAAMRPGKEEHRALLVLMAEIQQHTGKYASAMKTLKELQSMVNAHSTAADSGTAPQLVMLARAKSHCWQGNFAATKEICDGLLESDPSRDALVVASARTGHAMSRLLTAKSLDDIFTVRDPFRMVLKSLENVAPGSLPLVAAHLNYGIAEVVYAQILEQERGITQVPLDGAMRSWKQGLSILQRKHQPRRSSKNTSSSSSTSSYGLNVVQALEARLQANMAWGLLQMKGVVPDNVKQASEYARQSLKIYDAHNVAFPMSGLNRTLSLVAQCYHQTGAAVTAEGLYQSAISMPHTTTAGSPLDVLNRRDVYLAYAQLCADWEKRERDAEKYQAQASEVDASLPAGWKGKSGIHSTLWFWLPPHFH